ncbi:MAG TPA: alpha-mannosidase [Firmicutes bacterium]|jgi:alpha-mannosidase|nr:alpha-mannosidase [Bacillota bacterium]
MFFVLERADKIAREMKEYIYAAKLTIKELGFKEGNFSGITAVDQHLSDWKIFPAGTRWGGKDRHGWFRAKVALPGEFNGKTVALVINTDVGTGVVDDAVNPQFMLYINGQFIQGIDINHREVIFVHRADAGHEYQIDLHAYSGMLEQQSDITAELVVVDESIKEFYYDLTVAIRVAEELPENDWRRPELLKIINDTINRLDLRQPFSENFYSSLGDAGDYLKQDFYGKMAGHQEAIATCVGHSHIDVAWLWTVEQTREKTARSFGTVLKLMEQYPDYVYMSSQPQLYQFLKEDYPDLYDKIKARAKEGRWEPEGAMWLEADCNLTSGESLVRQLLYGTRFFKQEFGVESKVLWLPDVFGYSAALPQILKKSGVDYFVTSKISWNQFNKLPYDTFMWRGIDGTEILSYFITTIYPGNNHHPYGTTYNGQITPHVVSRSWDHYLQKDVNNDILIAYGYGDGGGGPTAEMLENAERLNKGLPGCPRVKLGKLGDYLEKLAAQVTGAKLLPKWVGELYLEFHRGTYTSMARNKRYNRKSEYLYQDVEFLSVLAMMLGRDYPQADIEQGWKIILLNQFHDILPGSSIREVYETSRQQYEKILEDGRELADKALTVVAAKIGLEKPSVIVFNTLSFRRNDLVIVNLEEQVNISSLEDQAGMAIPVQMVEEGSKRKAIFYAPDLPPKGYHSFALGNQPAPTEKDLLISQTRLENKFFVLEIDAKGTISSFYDKTNQRQLLKPGERGNKLQAFEDKPMNWDNWDIDIYYQEKEWEIDNVTEAEVIETGPVRGGIRITKQFSRSRIMQKIYIYQDIPRIDFETWVDWKEDQVLLKVAFPLDIHADKATYDIQFGNVERPTHWNTSWDWSRFEVCAHKWADISEAGFGVSLLNDCKYGHDIKDGNMRLTLLKSGNMPNKDADREEHHFVYSLYPHTGDWRRGQTVQMAFDLNVPLYAKVEKAHPGSLPNSCSIFELDQENVILESVKKAEDSDSIVVRLYECYNQRSRVRLSSTKQLLEVWECDLMENNLQPLVVTENGFEFEMKPYEIKTYKIKTIFR